MLFILPGAYELDEDDPTAILWVLKAHIGDRDRGWRTVVYPLPFDDPEATTEPVEIEPTDPYTARIRSVFDIHVPPIHDSALVPPCSDRFSVYFHSDGPYALATPLFGFS